MSTYFDLTYFKKYNYKLILPVCTSETNLDSRVPIVSKPLKHSIFRSLHSAGISYLEKIPLFMKTCQLTTMISTANEQKIPSFLILITKVPCLKISTCNSA